MNVVLLHQCGSNRWKESLRKLCQWRKWDSFWKTNTTLCLSVASMGTSQMIPCMEIYIFKMDFNCANWLDVGGVSIQFILNVRENSNLCIKLLFVIVIAFTFSLLLLLLLYLPSSYASIFLILVSWYWLNNMVRQQWGKETTPDSESLDLDLWQGWKKLFSVKV